MIEIVNLRLEKMAHPYDFRCDRDTPLGNPYVMKNESYRLEACTEYEDWFQERVDSGDERVLHYLRLMLDRHKEHGKLRLFCWCHPKQCHLETIKKWLEERLNRQEDENNATLPISE
jgi:hypothetical protein